MARKHPDVGNFEREASRADRPGVLLTCASPGVWSEAIAGCFDVYDTERGRGLMKGVRLGSRVVCGLRYTGARRDV